MSLAIQTFSNRTGPNVLYKALSHPLAAQQGKALIDDLATHRRVAIYDVGGWVDQVAALHDLSPLNICEVLVQDSEAVGREVLDQRCRPVTDLPDLDIDAIWIISFDSDPLLAQITHLIADGLAVFSLDAMRIPAEWVSEHRRYLSAVNFVTNFAFFRDSGDRHTRLVSANYWGGYGARSPVLRGILFGEQGQELARFDRPLGDTHATVEVDSCQLRDEFGLGDFNGQLFIHLTGAAGHDVFKYALDTVGASPRALSCTHDANAWPADRYGGLPTPRPGEKVLLWVQNSHAVTIPSAALSLKIPGDSRAHQIPQSIAPFATQAIDVGALIGELPTDQVMLECGRYLVRPRYEIEHDGHCRIAHLNVVREDLKADPDYAEQAGRLGKGYLLPAPLPNPATHSTELLVTPMSSAQDSLGLRLLIFDSDGRLRGDQSLGLTAAADHRWLSVDPLIVDSLDGEGHLELCHDAAQTGVVDGWFHAIFRYRHRNSGHVAETSFGCHMYNGIMTYRNEPQSYAGPPPGLSTRLYLRIGGGSRRTFCHLIYPTSTKWHDQSQTRLILHDGQGRMVEEIPLTIPVNGSRRFVVDEVFSDQALRAAGDGAWVMIRDLRCRLFGYHGLVDEDCFSLDHMFGF